MEFAYLFFATVLSVAAVAATVGDVLMAIPKRYLRPQAHTMVVIAGLEIELDLYLTHVRGDGGYERNHWEVDWYRVTEVTWYHADGDHTEWRPEAGSIMELWVAGLVRAHYSDEELLEQAWANRQRCVPADRDEYLSAEADMIHSDGGR